MVKSRAGFGMIEVVVALTLLSVGLLSVVALAALAGRVLREARADEQATLEAQQLLDSLSQLALPGSGQRSVGRLSISWTLSAVAAGSSAIELVVEYPNGTERRRLRFRATSRGQ